MEEHTRRWRVLVKRTLKKYLDIRDRGSKRKK
jgi:hypothetical protein